MNQVSVNMEICDGMNAEARTAVVRRRVCLVGDARTVSRFFVGVYLAEM